jgi:hypothetical protein
MRPLFIHSFSDEMLDNASFEAPLHGQNLGTLALVVGNIYQWTSCACQYAVRAYSECAVPKARDGKFRNELAGGIPHGAEASGHHLLSFLRCLNHQLESRNWKDGCVHQAV